MAVYTNLAIDCGENESAAIELFDVYRQLRLESSEFATVGCDVEHIKPNRHWGQPDKVAQDAGAWHTLCVSPAGIGNGLPLSDSLKAQLRPQLYAPLKQTIQFRSAWFGWEAQDALGEIDWLDILGEMNRTGVVPDMPGLILASEFVSNDSARLSLQEFCPGYLWYESPSND